MLKNFSVCPHCTKKGASGALVRIQESTPIVSRSDGESFHLFLQNGPMPQLLPGGGETGNLLAHFRYVRDAASANSYTVDLLLSGGKNVIKEIESAADVLAARLAAGSGLSYAYSFLDGSLQTLRSAPRH